MTKTIKLSLASGRDTRNNIFCEDGHPIYKATTSFAITGRVTTICKAIQDGASTTTPANEHRFHPVARIDWHVFESPVLRFEDGEVKSRDNFYSTGLETRGDDRVFFGPDGQEYQWKFSTDSKPKLYLSADSGDILVASFHGSSLGIRSPKRNAYLEIFPGGSDIMDVIVATLLVEPARGHRVNSCLNLGTRASRFGIRYSIVQPLSWTLKLVVRCIPFGGELMCLNDPCRILRDELRGCQGFPRSTENYPKGGSRK